VQIIRSYCSDLTSEETKLASRRLNSFVTRRLKPSTESVRKHNLKLGDGSDPGKGPRRPRLPPNWVWCLHLPNPGSGLWLLLIVMFGATITTQPAKIG
jgi:hypothetical protein